MFTYIANGATCWTSHREARVVGRRVRLDRFILRFGVIVGTDNIEIPARKNSGLTTPSGCRSRLESGHGQANISLLMIISDIGVDIHAKSKHGKSDGSSLIGIKLRQTADTRTCIGKSKLLESILHDVAHLKHEPIKFRHADFDHMFHGAFESGD